MGGLDGIVGNVFQSVFGSDAYPAIEEKAAHLLYFIIKNHPFADGNKRSGAFAFVWFLSQAKKLNASKLTPETLGSVNIANFEVEQIDFIQFKEGRRRSTSKVLRGEVTQNWMKSICFLWIANIKRHLLRYLSLSYPPDTLRSSCLEYGLFIWQPLEAGYVIAELP